MSKSGVLQNSLYIFLIWLLFGYDDVMCTKRLLLNDQELIHKMQLDIQNLKSRLAQQEQRGCDSCKSQGIGGTYVRWGRKECPGNSTELVYTGFAAGSHYTDTGAAADYLCLPSSPHLGAVWSDSRFGSVYGAEYETNVFGKDTWDDDVPCAVCRTPSASSVLMIAARNQCYNGWTTEYVGQLAGGHHVNVAASSFVCVDNSADVILGGEANQDGKLFYPIKTVCGSLKCPPYHNDRLLPCVVCSK